VKPWQLPGPRRVVAVAALAVYLAGFAAALGPAGLAIAASAVVVGAIAVVAARLADHPLELRRPTRLPALPQLPTIRRPERLPPLPKLTPSLQRLNPSLQRLNTVPRLPHVDVEARLRVVRPHVLRTRDRVATTGRETYELLSARGRAVVAQARDRTAARRSEEPDLAVELNRNGAAARREGRVDDAIASHLHALEIYRRAGSRRRQALTLSNLGLAQAETDLDAATASFEAALALLREIDDVESEGQVLTNLGSVYQRAGRAEEATRCWEQAVDLLDPESPQQARLAARLTAAG